MPAPDFVIDIVPLVLLLITPWISLAPVLVPLRVRVRLLNPFTELVSAVLKFAAVKTKAPAPLLEIVALLVPLPLPI